MSFVSGLGGFQGQGSGTQASTAPITEFPSEDGYCSLLLLDASFMFSGSRDSGEAGGMDF